MTMAKIKKLIPTERQEQKALVKWIKTQPKLRDYIIKLDNEGLRTYEQVSYIKAMGLCEGASDLFLAYPTTKHHGLWIEMKRNKKYPPSAKETATWCSQIRFHRLMKEVGFAAEFCYGWEEAKRLIENYLMEN